MLILVFVSFEPAEQFHFSFTSSNEAKEVTHVKVIYFCCYYKTAPFFKTAEMNLFGMMSDKHASVLSGVMK